MATIVTYNDVTFYNVLTRSWNEEVFYDKTGTDEIGKKLSLTFEGIIHAQRIPLTDSDVYVTDGNNEDNQYDLLTSLRKRLNHPRKTLVVSFDDEEILKIVPSDIAPGITRMPPNADIDNGPHPKVIGIVPKGSNAFKVLFAIDCSVSACETQFTGEYGVVLNNRWSITETMDANYFTTRTISGELRLAAGVSSVGESGDGTKQFTTGNPGHKFKNLCVPRLEAGFKRDSVMFSSGADGLTCTYQVQDKQVHTSAPWPATDMEYSHTESSQFGTHFTSECMVRLNGDPACDKRFLVERAIQVMDVMCGLRGLPDYTSSYIEDFRITDRGGRDAVVEGYVRVNMTHKAELTNAQISSIYKNIGAPLKLDPLVLGRSNHPQNNDYKYNLSRVPSLYGYEHGNADADHERRPAVLMFLHCYLQNPCNGPHSIGPANTQSSTAIPSGPGADPTSSYVQDISSAGSLTYSPSSSTLSEATRSAIYTVANTSSIYDINPMIVGLPIANLNSNYSPLNADRNGKVSLPNAALFGPQSVDTTRVVPLAAPQMNRVHTVNLERLGKPPEIPTPYPFYKDGETTAFLARSAIESLPPVRSPDGNNLVYRCIVRYVYRLTRPVDSSRNLLIGSNPAYSFGDKHSGRMPLHFNDRIIDAVATIAPGPKTG